MARVARLLLVLSAIAALLAVVIVGLFAKSLSVDDFWQQLVGVARSAFGSGSWSWLSQVTLAVVMLAGVVGALDVVLRIPRIAPGRSFGALPAGARDALREVEQRVRACAESGQADVVVLLDELFRGAEALGASDVHVTPGQHAGRITYRVEGTLHEVATVDAGVLPRLATRVKVLAQLDPFVRGVPQDGRLNRKAGHVDVEARVSTLPTELGERIAMRIVRGGRKAPTLDVLGFDSTVLARLEQLLSRPQGLFFVTGPVGSGKTTTLYAALQYIAERRGRTTTLVSLEDPIETELPFVTQTRIHPKSGMTFASALRSVLRQDPNVLMVGEIRDRETAEIAAQAGLTGHLILTTVHAQSAAGPFARIVDMGVEPFAVASSVVGSLSQRLVRRLCTACRKEAAPEPMIRDRFQALGAALPDARYYEAVGCDFCEGQGYTGRAPLAELLVMDEELRRAVNNRRPSAELYQLALSVGMTPLIEDGLARARQGETSLTEILRVAG